MKDKITINWIGLFTLLRREVKRTFRVVIQTIFAPVISATLYILIFGKVIGSRITEISGVPYVTFVFPGILLLSVINASFASASSSIYFMRFNRSIEEILIAPFSYLEMLISFIGSALVRALLISFLILGVGLAFGAVSLNSLLFFILSVSSVSAIFAMLGIIVALWADNFEQLQVLNTFFISPLTYLGGIFYSISFLPETAVLLTKLNPFFYFVDAVRFSMIGISEANSFIGTTVIVSLIVILSTLIIWLFKIGWKIRS